jgi:hypothetical protein
MESLLRKPNKIALLGYIAFESLQVAFYLSLAIYLLIPLIYYTDADWRCPPTPTPRTGEEEDPKDNDCDDSGNPKSRHLSCIRYWFDFSGRRGSTCLPDFSNHHQRVFYSSDDPVLQVLCICRPACKWFTGILYEQSVIIPSTFSKLVSISEATFKFQLATKFSLQSIQVSPRGGIEK